MSEISAQSLYHYTSIEFLKSILKARGFRYSMRVEEIPYKERSFKQTNFVVCFSDLPVSDVSRHRASYGPVGIALKKEWGILHGVSPVRYIHSRSPGLSDAYMTLRSAFRLPEFFPEESRLSYRDEQILLAAITRWLSDKYGLDNIKEMRPRTNTPEEHQQVEKFGQELRLLTNDESSEVSEIARHTIAALMWHIRLLHNELETRNSYLRLHEDVLPTGERIKIYDEREWRASFEFNVEEPIILSPDSTPNGKQWLRDDCNLLFEDSDVDQIVVANEVQYTNLKLFLESNIRTELVEKLIIIPIELV